ncbi:hypothetical protein ALC62_04626 [Cyphomyrmex costatus]|uniref:Uncharacterized protein n=1 Tax=Cyphomyrmex costatus TaxID=456900 RepID=A0A151IK05_9HYME|nr:hypothetical protein ALC62_04626 [Cyphomyrmex costatus]
MYTSRPSRNEDPSRVTIRSVSLADVRDRVDVKLVTAWDGRYGAQWSKKAVCGSKVQIIKYN